MFFSRQLRSCMKRNTVRKQHGLRKGRMRVSDNESTVEVCLSKIMATEALYTSQSVKNKKMDTVSCRPISQPKF